MDKTESTVRMMLIAIEAPLYDVGVLSERGMFPRLDGISAAAVLDRLSILKYRNAHGAHIYIRPTGEHRYTTLDDLSETSLARLSAHGFTPCAVVETNAGADIAFCVATHASGMTEDRIERALEDEYLSRDPSASKRAAYIRRTMEKARRCVGR